jgi:hypothetical protein
VEHSILDIRGIEGELLVPVGLGVRRCATRSASDTALPPRRRYALKVTLSCATVGKDVSSPPPRQCAQRVPGRVEWQGGRGCLHLGAWRDGPLTDNPPEGYTRVRAPSAPDERLSRTRGSPVGRLAGLPGRRAVRPIPSGAAPGTVVLSPRACPVSSPVGAGTGAFLAGFGVHSFWRLGPWGLAMRPRAADMAPGAARGGGAYRCPACGGKCRGSGPRRPRPPARFWSCSKRVPALP